MRSAMSLVVLVSGLFSSLTTAVAAESAMDAPDNTSYLVTGFECVGLESPDSIKTFFPDDKAVQDTVVKLDKYHFCERVFELLGAKKYAWISVTDIEALGLLLNNHPDFKSVDLRIVPTDVKGQVVLRADFVKKAPIYMNVENTFSLYDGGKGVLNSLNVEVASRKSAPLGKWTLGIASDLARAQGVLKSDVGAVEIRDYRDIAGKDQKGYYSVTPYVKLEGNLHKQFSAGMEFSLTNDNDGNFKRDITSDWKKDLTASLSFTDRFWYGIGELSVTPLVRIFDQQGYSSSDGENDQKYISTNIDRAKISNSPDNENTDGKDVVINGEKKIINDNPDDIGLYGLKYRFSFGTDASRFKVSQAAEYYKSMKDKDVSMRKSTSVFRANFGKMLPSLNGFYGVYTWEQSESKGIVLPTERYRGHNPVRQKGAVSVGYRPSSGHGFALSVGSESVYSNSKEISYYDANSKTAYFSADSYITRSNNKEAAGADSEFVGASYGYQGESLNLNLGARYYVNRMF